jgi:hypothetical protein
LQTTVQIGAEFRVRRLTGAAQGAHDQLAARRERVEALGAQGAETADHTVPHDGVADRATDHEPDACGVARSTIGAQQVHHERGAAAASPAP